MATGADLSLPWDYNKAMAFLRSRPLLYDTSRINQTFSNILQVRPYYDLHIRSHYYTLHVRSHYHTLHV